MGILWEMVGMGGGCPWAGGAPDAGETGEDARKQAAREAGAQDPMDGLSVAFCERLHAVNGFVTEIVAGHVVRVGRDADG